MAEVLGVVASGIAVGQLASELTGSIIKLKGYWDQVKEAPDDIRQLLLEIDSLNLILCHIQNEQAQGTTSKSGSNKIFVEQSLNLCKEGADELSALVIELAEKIEGKQGWRRKTGAAKVMLKKEDIKRLKRRMKNSIRLLSLAYQCHTNAMIQLQPDIIAAKISHAINSATSDFLINSSIFLESSSPPEMAVETLVQTGTADDEAGISQVDTLARTQYAYWTGSSSWVHYLVGSLQYCRRYETSRHQQRLKMRARYKCPAWLSERACDAIALHQSYRGWKYHFQTYRSLYYDHDIFRVVRTGDIASLQRMLVTREGYITDRSYSGRTLLHYAIQYRQFEMCKLLLDAGADPSGEDIYHCNTMMEVGILQSQTAEARCQAIDLCRLLLNAGFDSNPLSTEHTWVRFFRGSAPLFQFLQQQMYPPYQELPMYERLNILHTISLDQIDGPDIFRMVLGNTTFNEMTVTETNSWGMTALHSIAHGYTYTNCDRFKRCEVKGNNTEPLSRHKFCHNPAYSGWSALLQEVLAAGSPLHAVDKRGVTPLCEILCEFWSWGEWLAQPFLTCALYAWLYDLHAAGVDLQDYGKQEMALGLKQKTTQPRHYGTEARDFGIIGFSYRPGVEDWHFWFTEPTDFLAGEFWLMVENLGEEGDGSHLTMPGSWME